MQKSPPIPPSKMTSVEEDELRGRAEEMPADNPTLSPPRPRLSQSRLHNFSFPSRSWGSQKLLRCMNIKDCAAGENVGSVPPAVAQHETGAGGKRPGSSSTEKSGPTKACPGGRDSKEADGRAPEQGEGEESSSSAAAAAAAVAAAVKPWNLRTRRAACNAPVGSRRRRNANSTAVSPAPLTIKKSDPVAKSVRLRSDDPEKSERPKFSISLSREEIEEDFMVFKGKKPPLRPKKRPRNIQKQLDPLFPGLWLSEITPDSYKTTD